METAKFKNITINSETYDRLMKLKKKSGFPVSTLVCLALPHLEKAVDMMPIKLEDVKEPIKNKKGTEKQRREKK